MNTPREVFLQILGETQNPLAALKTTRERFGLSLAQAKEVWFQATGAGSLSEHQQKLAPIVEQALRENNI